MQSERVKSVSPLVVSASRVTDIPAFHAQWFMERLRAGFCERVHPRFPSRKTVISFSHCKVVVFWTKNPGPIMPYLDEIRERGFQFYFHYTLNDYEQEHLEPGVPLLESRIDCFCRLAEAIGKEKVIWRFDPVLCGKGIDVPEILRRIHALGQRLYPYTERLVFSFLDMYASTQRSLAQFCPLFRAPTKNEQYAIAAGIAELNQGWNLELRTCAEALDVSKIGVLPGRCIEPALIRRLCPSEPEVVHFCDRAYARDQFALPGILGRDAPKDTAQRKLCGCAPSRDIGTYNTCGHACVYCYARGAFGEQRPGKLV